jgi:hypothetical protein
MCVGLWNAHHSPAQPQPMPAGRPSTGLPPRDTENNASTAVPQAHVSPPRPLPPTHHTHTHPPPRARTHTKPTHLVVGRLELRSIATNDILNDRNNGDTRLPQRQHRTCRQAHADCQAAERSTGFRGAGACLGRGMSLPACLLACLERVLSREYGLCKGRPPSPLFCYAWHVEGDGGNWHMCTLQAAGVTSRADAATD